jgi:hypothetical protein
MDFYRAAAKRYRVEIKQLGKKLPNAECDLIGEHHRGGADMKKKKEAGKEISIVRSSAAEYLTFVAATGSGGVEALYADESIWLMFSDSELEKNAVIRNFRITAADGKTYNTKHYKLPTRVNDCWRELPLVSSKGLPPWPKATSRLYLQMNPEPLTARRHACKTPSAAVRP